MPVTWGLPTTLTNLNVQDVERFNKLPFWIAKQQTVQLAYFSVWKDLFGTIPWKFNMGDVLVGVVSEYSPVVSQVHKPKFITNTPLKTVASHFERSNTARIYEHDFESPMFSFLSSMRDFNTDQIGFAARDLNRQIAIGYDNFIRWQIVQMSPSVFVCGAANPIITGLPVGPPGEGSLADPKTDAVFQTLFAQVGADGFLSFRNIVAARSAARNVIGMVPWDGDPGKPSDNSIQRGKFILIGEALIYEGMQFDTHVLNTRPLAMDLLHKDWQGVIAENILFRSERYPLLFSADGSRPAPEIEQALPVNGTITSGSSSVTNPGGAVRIEVVPNPDYINAPFGMAFLLGHQPYDSIDIGPPPAEFANAKTDTTRIAKLSWNGEVRLTDDLLVPSGSATGATLETTDTNKYGRYLQLICSTVLGIMPKTTRNALPIIYRRNIYPSLVVTV